MQEKREGEMKISYQDKFAKLRIKDMLCKVLIRSALKFLHQWNVIVVKNETYQEASHLNSIRKQ